MSKYKMIYAGSNGKGCTIYLDEDPRTGICQSCGKSIAKGEIKVTAFHHWYYPYKADTVKQNPKLALECTSELCFTCHKIGDALRLLLYNQPQRVAKLMKCIVKDAKDDQKSKIKMILKMMLESLDALQKSSVTTKDISAFSDDDNE